MLTAYRIAIALLFIWSGTGSDAAETGNQIARCAAIRGDLERLECFDEIARSAGLNRPQLQPSAAAGTGKWELTHDKNPIDDSERVVIALAADTGRSTYGERIAFVARCQSNKTEAYINWNDFLGDDSHNVYREWKYVTIRIGDNKAERQQWGVSTDSKATFAPDWAGDLLKEMTKAATFLAQVTPYNESPVTEFSTPEAWQMH
jgi:type VI secretion system protein VasI